MRTAQVSKISMIMVCLFTTLLAPISKSFAAESIPQIARQKAEKELVVKYLQNRLNRHSTMTTAAIIADLNATAELNRVALTKNKPDTATSFEKLVAQESDRLRQIGDRDVILAIEAARIQEVSSSDNYMLYIMNHGGPALAYLVCTCGNPTISLIFAIFLVPFDLVALPIEFLASAFTGF